MTLRGNEFFDALRRLDKQSQNRLLLPEQSTVRAFRQVAETFTTADTSEEIEERQPGTTNYLCIAANSVLNGDFETDLTGWTENNHGSITATTGQVSNESSKTLFGSQGSLKVDVTDSTATGQQAERYQDISAGVGETWSFEVWAKISGLSNCKGIFRIEWQDSGDSVLSTTDVEVTSNDTIFTLRQIENETSPASTDHVRIKLRMESTGANATGTGYFDLVRAESGESAVSDRARRIIAGEFVCRT